MTKIKCPKCGEDISKVFASLGGKERSKKLSAKRMSEIARMGGKARHRFTPKA